MSLAKNPRPQQRCTTDFALSGKGGGQMSEKAVFVRASNMDYTIFFAIKTSQAIGTQLLVLLPLPTRKLTKWRLELDYYYRREGISSLRPA